MIHQQALILLVDISGYSKFLSMHRLKTLHAEAIITELLEAIIHDIKSPLQINKLEGDAALLYAGIENPLHPPRKLIQDITLLFQAFENKKNELIECNLCPCEACTSVKQLKLKGIVHTGPVIIKKVAQFEELAGEPIILAHRLLKNSIIQDEYLLLSEEAFQLAGDFTNHLPHVVVEEAQEFGTQHVYVYYSDAIFEDHPIKSSAFSTAEKLGIGMKQMMVRQGHAMKSMLHMDEPRVFHHLA